MHTQIYDAAAIPADPRLAEIHQRANKMGIP